MQQHGVKPLGPPGGGGVGGRGGSTRDSGTCTPRRADAVELEKLLAGVKTKKGGGEAVEKELLETPF